MKYRFELTYQTKYMVDASDLLKNLDLEMDEIAFQDTITFSTQKDIEISVLKEIIKKYFESSECVSLKIEGGKVE